jgi:uncharacterized protein
MIGLLIELAISWALLWFVQKEHLNALGLSPTKSRIFQLVFGIVLAAFCCAAYSGMVLAFGENEVSVNKNFSAVNFAYSSWWVLSSVLFEELIFRGALLFILIHYIGENKACLVSAVGFGIYHWFSFGVLGNPVPMTYVFIMTGIWGYMYAMSFAKTKSLYLPIGLHFGWNFVNIVIFSNGPLGQQFLIINTQQKIEGVLSLLLFLFQVLAVPIIILLHFRPRKQETGDHSASL